MHDLPRHPSLAPHRRYVFDSEEAAAAASSSERYIVAKSEGEARQQAEAQYGAGVVLKQVRWCGAAALPGAICRACAHAATCSCLSATPLPGHLPNVRMLATCTCLGAAAAPTFAALLVLRRRAMCWTRGFPRACGPSPPSAGPPPRRTLSGAPPGMTGVAASATDVQFLPHLCSPWWPAWYMDRPLEPPASTLHPCPCARHG